jgi:serine/threonine-protein kinase
MRRLLLTALIIVLGASQADARHGRSWLRYWGRAPSAALAPAPYPEAGFRGRSARAQVYALRGEFPPADWQLQAPDPNWKGRRYVAPAGDAWLALYASPADQESTSAHLKTVAFADGEDVLTVLGDRNGLVVTGTKGDRMFLRKAKLACGGRQWHHVALEFPAGAQRAYQPLIARAMRIVDLAEDDGCATPVAGNEP